jgi:carboxypeptidase Q
MYHKLLTAGLLLFLGAGMRQAGFAQAGSGKTASVAGRSEDSLFLRRLADEILVNGKAYSNLRTLTKTIGGRLSGSPQYYQAEAWGQKALQDAGADKVWLQECMVPHWVRGGKDSASWEVVSGRRVGLDILALGNSLGTGLTGTLAPVVLIHSFEELERRKDEIKGKIVFYNYSFNPRLVETFRSYSDAVCYRVFGPSQAAKYGAIGVLVRSMTHSVDNNPHTGAMVYNDSFPKIPAAAVGLWDADKLADALEKKGSGTLKVYLRTQAQMLPDTLAHNVIGEIRGSEFPDEFITVGGHLDSWDPAEGAQDDGAGCVHSIEVLRALKAIGYKPRHSIRVVLFANEENGGRGGEKYADEAKARGEKHLFGLESDAGGFTPRGFSISLSEEQLAGIRPWLQLLQPYGVYAFDKGGGGADVTPLETKLGSVVGELRPDSQRYFDYHHSRGDVLEAVNKRELELGALNMAALVYLVDKYGWTSAAH